MKERRNFLRNLSGIASSLFATQSFAEQKYPSINSYSEPLQMLKVANSELPKPIPFKLHVADQSLKDLKSRLGMTRLPDQSPDQSLSNNWMYGTNLSWMKKLLSYWSSEFDWRMQEAKLNEFDQFKVNLHGINLHYIHVKGKGPNPIPLLLSHGWPGSVYEFMKIIPRLTDPVRFGGRAEDSFTVIAPSLPGYGLSFEQNQPRFSVEQIAACFKDLMTKVLGYDKFVAQGGDWGSVITTRLGEAYPEHVLAIHITLLSIRRDHASLLTRPLSVEEQNYSKELALFVKEETGYQAIQGTRPQTLAYALNDSPAGLAAWIVEKFYMWSDCDGDLESIFTLDELLADISLYWFTGTIGSSFWPYYARSHGGYQIPANGIKVPMGYAQFPKEIYKPPRSFAEAYFTNIIRWTEHKKGGHFSAMEQPEVLSEEIRKTFNFLRTV